MKMKCFELLILHILCLNVQENFAANLNNSIRLLNNSSELDCTKGTLLSTSVCVPFGYLKGEVPDTPTIVKTTIEINNIREIDDRRMRLTLDFYEELKWIDNRIKTNLSTEKAAVLNNNLINHVWKPDLWIQNIFDFKLHSILEPTAGFIIKNKEACQSKNCTDKEFDTLVTYNLEAQATIYCNFHFVSYPMDTQYCDLVMDGSYPYPDIVFFSFELGVFGVTSKHSNTDAFSINITFKQNTNQSGIQSTIKLERSLLPFVIKYYLPCIAIIVVSLVSFLISVTSIPARVALLVTQFLTLTNVLIAQQKESPSSGKFTALGVYLLTSLFFVVAAFVEFACVLHLHHTNEKQAKNREKEIKANNEKKIASEENDNHLSNGIPLVFSNKQRFNIKKMDLICFVIGAIMYISFNIIYWTIFLTFHFD